MCGPDGGVWEGWTGALYLKRALGKHHHGSSWTALYEMRLRGKKGRGKGKGEGEGGSSLR